MKKFIYIFILILFPASFAHAANLTVNVPNSINQGERITLDIYVDTEGESINSVEINESFSSETLTFDGYSNIGSSIPIWIEEPKEISPGLVHFSGIIPGGIERLYDPQNPNNHKIRLARLFFVAKSPGVGTFSTKNAQILRNDGKGTSVELNLPTTSRVTIKQNLNEKGEPIINIQRVSDTNPPPPFTVSILDGSLFGRTPRLAIFKADDNEGGIHHYETKIGFGEFTIASSPYPLPYRLASFTLSVRAYDFSGNFTEQQVVVPGEKTVGIGLFSLIVILIVVFYRYILRYKRRKKKSYESSKTDL